MATPKATRVRREYGGSVYKPPNRPGWRVRYRDPVTGKRIDVYGGETQSDAELALHKFAKGDAVPERAQEQRVEAQEAEAADERGCASMPLWPYTANEDEMTPAQVAKLPPSFARDKYLPSFGNPRRPRHARIVRAQLRRAGKSLAHPMHTVDRVQAMAYIDSLTAAGVGASTLRRHKAALSKCWKKAIEMKFALVNPWTGLEMPKIDAPSIRFRPEAEVSDIVARAPKQIRPLVKFIAETGCRYEEAAGMRWSEVAADLSRITIPGERSKTRKVRIIRVEGEARRVLEERQAKRVLRTNVTGDFVFALRPASKKGKSQPKPYSHGYAFKLLQKALQEHGIPCERPFHTLRNSLASRMAMRGVPLSVIAEAIGDSLETTSKSYAHLVPDDAVARAYREMARPQAPRTETDSASPTDSAAASKPRATKQRSA